jgi:post-segregation antitoxin (ccd killing protein)
MRLIVRTATWVLAAVGIKALYDRLVPKARELREPASQVLDTAKSSSRELVDHAKAAGTEVLTDARDRSVNIREAATDAIARADASEKAPRKGRTAVSTNKASKH